MLQLPILQNSRTPNPRTGFDPTLLLISVWKQAGNKLRRALSPPLNASLLPILCKSIYQPVVTPGLFYAVLVSLGLLESP